VEESAIILFTRIPLPGKTKTRLQPFLTAEECCLLQSAFIRDIYEVLRGTKTACDIFVCYTPKGNLADLRALLPEARIFFPQQGKTLGERMSNAIRHVFDKGYNRCILTGSDLPLLHSCAVDDAFNLLEKHDIVLCPTEDGGYYLIGMKQLCEEVFRLEEYGVSSVFEKTLAAAAKCGRTCAVGHNTMDIDEKEDLVKLQKMLAADSNLECKETRIVLKEIFLKRG